MIYTLEKANLIAEQLQKFTTGYAHHLAGQFANIDFWLDEVVLALKTIDGHRKRFEKMYEAQKDWTEKHEVIVHEYCPICRGICEFSTGKPSLPQLRYKCEKKQIRQDLVDATYFFLVRCYNIGLLSNVELKEKCDLIGTGIDPNDLK